MTDAAAINAMTSTLNGLPAVRRGVSSCPGFSDGPAVVLFSYARRPVVAVTVFVPDTCFLVTNGHRVRQAQPETVRSLRRVR